MEKQFPNTHLIQQEARVKLSGATTLKVNLKVPYSTIGTAFDYRARYYFAITPPEDFVAYQGAQNLQGMEVVYNDKPNVKTTLFPPTLISDFFSDLTKTVKKINPPGRRLERSQEEMLARQCIVLALFEEIFRGGVSMNSPLILRDHIENVSDFLSIAEKHWIDDLCSMSWLFYEQFKESLSHSVILNPVFEGSKDVGGADADIILDHCLIDFKSTLNPKIDSNWLYQLLGYVLLDYDDLYQIREIGIYMVRQGILLRWPLHTIIEVLSGIKNVSIDKLRQQFQKAIYKKT